MLRRVLLSAAAMPFLHGVAAAQGGEAVVLPGISVTASPLGQTVDEMATPVASLSGEDIVRRREATLGATLNGLPGVHVDQDRKSVGQGTRESGSVDIGGTSIMKKKKTNR